MPQWLHSLLHGLDSLRHSLHWGDMPAYLSAAVAIAFGILSLRASGRSKAAERASKDQADRATTAAEDAVAAQNTIAAEIRRLGDDSARQQEDKERAPWRIDKLARDDYRLVNLRPTSKYHVRLRGEPVRPDGNYFPEISGNDSVSIDLFIRPEQYPDPTITVTWHPTRDHTGPAWEQPCQP